MQKSIYELIATEQTKKEVQRVLECNVKTETFGLVLTQEEANELLEYRRHSLTSQRRVEFGEGILPKIIEAFCDSQYIQQSEYAEILQRLQDIFYLYKNESGDQLTDDELITFMKEQFEGVCYGSLEYLEETCLERFARAVRAGYSDYQAGGGVGEYEKFSEEKRWDREVFLLTLEELLN